MQIRSTAHATLAHLNHDDSHVANLFKRMHPEADYVFYHRNQEGDLCDFAISTTNVVDSRHRRAVQRGKLSGISKSDTFYTEYHFEVHTDCF